MFNSLKIKDQRSKPQFKIKKYIIIFLLSFACLPAGTAFAADVPTFYGREVVVTAARLPQFKSESMSKVVVITSEDLKASGARNLFEALKFSEGIDLKTTGYLGAQATVRMRGSIAEEVLVLLNGCRISSPLLGLSDLNDLLVEDVDRVEIVYGPVSALYGSSANGGVINIISQKPVLGAKYEAELGSFNTQKYRLMNSDQNSYFGLSYGRTDGFRTNSDYAYLSFDAGLNYDLSRKAKLALNMYHYQAPRGVPGSTVYPLPNTRQTDRNNFISASLDYKFSQYYDLKVKGNYSTYHQTYNSDPNLYNDERYGAQTTGLEIQNDLKLSRTNRLLLGFDLRNDHGDSDKAGRHSLSNKAVYFQDEQKLGQAASLSFGLRYDRHSVAGVSTNPRLGFVFHPRSDTTIRSSFATAFRAPTLNELYWYHYDPVWGIVTRGNTNLRPEVSQTFDLGVSRQLNETTLASITWYTSQAKDLIQWVDVSGSWATWEAQNLSQTKSDGVEFELKKHFGANASSFVNYTYQKSINSQSGKNLAYAPRNKFNAGLIYSPKYALNSAIYIRHVGERYDDAANSASKKLPAYTVVDMRLWQKLGEITYALNVGNLLDAQYQDTLNYTMPGRTFAISVASEL